MARAPGLGPSLSLYRRAAQGQEGERFGIGALRMGVQGANPNLSALLSEQSQRHREQEAAGGLEQAVALKNAEVTGSVLPLASLQNQQRMGLASLASGNAQNTMNTYTSFLARPKQRSFWQDLLLSGVQGAASIGI